VKVDECLAAQYLEKHPDKASYLLATLSLDDVSQYLQSVEPSIFVGLARAFPPFIVAHCLKTVEQSSVIAALEQATPEEVAGWLMLIDDESKKALLNAISSHHQIRVLSFLRKKQDTAIFYIDTSGLTFSPRALVGDVFKQIKSSPKQVLSYLYVLNEDQKLLGVVAAKEFIKADPNKKLCEIMKSPVISLEANLSKKDILLHPAWSDFHALPVVDSENRFLGCLRYGRFKILEKEEQYGEESFFNISVNLFEAMIIIFLEMMDSLVFLKQKDKP
jgi:magnesium transporter